MIRTVALVGHAGSGKTTLTEALLYKTGAKERRGRVEEGTTTTDYTPEAKLHRTTVRTGVAPLLFRGHRVFLLDAPGYGDFVGEIRGALEAADAALVAVSAEAGVQVGTERAWTVAERLGLPRMVVVTKLDKGGDYYALLEDLRSTLGPILPIDLPLYEGGKWVGLIDVFHGKAYRYENGEEREAEVPPEERERVQRFRQEVLEAIEGHVYGVDPENGIGMALYVADVSEPGRGVNEEIRELALAGRLKEAYRLAVRNKVHYLKAKKIPIHPRTLEVYHSL